MALSISTRVIGRRRPLLDDFSVEPPQDMPGGDDFRLRDLIEHVVRCEVKAFLRRQSDRRFDRALSKQRIEADAAKGKVDPAAKSLKQRVDVEEAVANALQAFEDGLYLVIIDEIERRSLDEPVHLREDSRLVFVRLAFLAGA